MIKRIINKVRETRWLYYLNRTKVRVAAGSSFKVGEKTALKRCTIHVVNGSLLIGEGCILDGVSIYINSGTVVLGKNSIIRGLPDCQILIDGGDLSTFDHSRIQCKRIWVRFGGVLSVGRYTTINEGSEIRCDERITIGSYCQISHDVNIWDTNTHCISTIEERKDSFETHFPYFGKEFKRPKTNPIAIGDFCWIGERSALLKGTELGNNVTIGFNTTVINQKISENNTVVTNIDNLILPG